MVIAVCDECGNVEELVERLVRTMEDMDGFESELVFVVAGDDGTAVLLERSPRIRLLRQEDRDGLAGAFRIGFAGVANNPEIVVTMDGDLNHRPEEIPRLVGALVATSADIVVGSRAASGAEIRGASIQKRALSRIGNFLIRVLFGNRVRDRSSGFRVYRSTALAGLPVEGLGFSFLPAMLLEAERQGLRIVEEPITFVQRKWGRSKLPLLATALGYLRMVIRYWGSRWGREDR